MKTINNAVADIIWKYLKEKKMSQYKLAQQSFLPYSTIRGIMQRKTSGVSLKSVILIANGLGVPLHEFLDEEIFSVDNLDFN